MRWLESLRETWEKLSERERRLLSITAGVLALMVMFVAVWTTSSALADVEQERDDIRSVLADIDRAEELVEKRAAERRAVEAKFRNKPPALAAFIEGKAREVGVEVRQVLEEPSKEVNGYRRSSVRVMFQGVSLRPVMKLIASIEEQQLPIAVERLQVQHYTAGDSFKVEIGVVSFESPRKKVVSAGGASKEDGAEGAKDGKDNAGEEAP